MKVQKKVKVFLPIGGKRGGRDTVIRASGPDGNIFRSIIKVMQGRDIQLLHIANREPTTLTLGDIEIFPKQRLVPKKSAEVHCE